MKVKIELQKGETQEYAEEMLYKALKSKKKIKEKKSHSEKFENAGIRAIEKEMREKQDRLYKELINEIIEIVGN
jgi:hypothetical protein